jgi:hypothetical protein
VHTFCHAAKQAASGIDPRQRGRVVYRLYIHTHHECNSLSPPESGWLGVCGTGNSVCVALIIMRRERGLLHYANKAHTHMHICIAYAEIAAPRTRMYILRGACMRWMRASRCAPLSMLNACHEKGQSKISQQTLPANFAGQTPLFAPRAAADGVPNARGLLPPRLLCQLLSFLCAAKQLKTRNTF